MNILMVTMQYGHAYTQGTERYVAMLSDDLRRRGHLVTILAGDPLGTRPRARLGEPVPGESNLLAYPTHGWMSVQGLPSRQLEALLRRIRPDIVHLNTPAHVGVGIMAACRAVGIPCIVTVHDTWWICPKGTLLRPDNSTCDGTPGWPTCLRCIAASQPRRWLQRLASLNIGSSLFLLTMYGIRAILRGIPISEIPRWIGRRTRLIGELNQADYVLFPSQYISRVVTPYLSHQRWQVVPNGLSESWFENPRPAASTVKAPPDLTIGFAGVLAPHKAPHLLLQAIRLLGWHQTRIRLAGGVGDEQYAVQLRHEAKGLNVEFVGHVPADEMPNYLRSLDVLVMTSVCPENCPYIVLESQTAGVPVVGSRHGGIVEQIPDERMLFQPGSVEGLSEALNYVRCNPGVAGETRVTSAKEMTSTIEAVYSSLLRANQ